MPVAVMLAWPDGPRTSPKSATRARSGVGLEQDVGRLEVAVDQAPRRAPPPARRQALLQQRRASAAGSFPRPDQQPIERLPRHVLHGEVVPAPLLPNRVDRHDVRMRQPGQGGRLAAEAAQEGFVAGQLSGQDLDGHPPAQRFIVHR